MIFAVSYVHCMRSSQVCSAKESTCQCGRHRFDPWVRKIPWRREYSSILAWRVPWIESGKLYSSWGHKELDMTKAQHSENKDHGICSHHFIANRWRNSGNSGRLYFWGAPKSLQMVTAVMKLKDTYSLGEKL